LICIQKRFAYWCAMPMMMQAELSDITTSLKDTAEKSFAIEYLKVTVWNILAPVWVEDKLYPGISPTVYASESRRSVLQQRLAAFDSHVILLNEVEKTEFVMLMDDGLSPLSSIWEDKFVPFPESMWSQGGGSGEWGLAILWRKGCWSEAEAFKHELPEPTPPAAFLRARFDTWNEVLLFGTAHLDGDACPPSVTRSQVQLLQMASAAGQLSLGGTPTIWGGDCNLTPFAPALAGVQHHNFQMASSDLHLPTAQTAFAGARLDHIFSSSSVRAVSTEIPQSPNFHCCKLAKCMHQVQLMMDLLGISNPPVPAGNCCWRRLLGCVLLLPMSIVVFFGLCLPICFSVRQCDWALREWGSDHLPVTVTFCRNNPDRT